MLRFDAAILDQFPPEQLLANSLLALLEAPPDNPHAARWFEHVELVLDTMPLSTGEYGIARNRCQSARRYRQAGEYGAARYELRLLLRGLSHHIDTSAPVAATVLWNGLKQSVPAQRNQSASRETDATAGESRP
jgi:hypothetical protein